MHRETIPASLLALMRFGVCVCAVFSIVSAPTLLADPIHNLDLHPHSDFFSSTPSGSAHSEPDSLIFKNSSLSEESSFFDDDPSLFTSFGHEDHWVWNPLAGKPNDGLHLGWETGVEHHHHHHYNGGDPNNGNPPTDPTNLVTEPEPSTAVSLLLSGLAIALFFRFRKGVSA